VTHATSLRNSAAIGPFLGMIAIAIVPAAYEAIKATLSDGAPRSIGPDGQMQIWLDHAVVDRLRALRRPGESYSDVILKLAEIKARGIGCSSRGSAEYFLASRRDLPLGSVG
jgi:hypothetical protein